VIGGGHGPMRHIPPASGRSYVLLIAVAPYQRQSVGGSSELIGPAGRLYQAEPHEELHAGRDLPRKLAHDAAAFGRLDLNQPTRASMPPVWAERVHDLRWHRLG
jgi:hypothetical protein